MLDRCTQLRPRRDSSPRRQSLTANSKTRQLFHFWRKLPMRWGVKFDRPSLGRLEFYVPCLTSLHSCTVRHYLPRKNTLNFPLVVNIEVFTNVLYFHVKIKSVFLIIIASFLWFLSSFSGSVFWVFHPLWFWCGDECCYLPMTSLNVQVWIMHWKNYIFDCCS